MAEKKAKPGQCEQCKKRPAVTVFPARPIEDDSHVWFLCAPCWEAADTAYRAVAALRGYRRVNVDVKP
jgi:hypothetical protein